MKMYCVSLPESKSRRESMVLQFEKLHLEFHFINGLRFNVDEGYPPGYDRKKRWRLSGKDLAPGEIGCLLSHRLAWATFLQSNDEFCCVIEDDVFIEPSFEKTTRELLEISSTWDVVRLYGSPYKDIPSRLGAKLKKFGKNSWLIDYFRQPGGCQGYILKRSAAIRLLEFTENFFDAVDNMIDFDWAHGLRLYGIEPRLVYEFENSVTTIPGRVKIKKSLSSKLFVELNRVPTAVYTSFLRGIKRIKYFLRGAELNQ